MPAGGFSDLVERWLRKASGVCGETLGIFVYGSILELGVLSRNFLCGRDRSLAVQVWATAPVLRVPVLLNPPGTRRYPEMWF